MFNIMSSDIKRRITSCRVYSQIERLNCCSTSQRGSDEAFYPLLYHLKRLMNSNHSIHPPSVNWIGGEFCSKEQTFYVSVLVKVEPFGYHSSLLFPFYWLQIVFPYTFPLLEAYILMIRYGI